MGPMEGGKTLVWNPLSDSETFLRPSKHVWAYCWHFLGLVASPNSPNRGFNLPPAAPTAHPPPIMYRP